ncbi:MAG: YdcF family protein [Defluviitaleaceae bacterium]|nr:YdcF family protein [Defluviitaleaceae bacterium]
MKAIKIFFVTVGILALLNLIFILATGNMHFGHIALGFLAVVVILYGAFFEKIAKKIHIALWLACSVPVFFVGFLAVYGRGGGVDYTEDAVIVLGAGLRGDEVGGHLARRLDTAIMYLNRNPNAVVVVSGGLGAGRNITEAEAMSRYLAAHGISPERILQEGASTSTYENLAFSKEILAGHFPDGFRAVVVTNDFHIFRAVRQARSLDIDAVGLGASTPWHSFAANYLREMLAIVNFLIFG